MPDEDAVIARLHALAAHPVDEHVADSHARLMALAPSGGGSRMRVRTMVAGGTLVAAMLTGTGIAAAAGNLPDPVQNAAHSALAKVGVDVPKGTPRSTEGCDGKTYKNHGQFVRSQPKEARAEAAKSPCGKPLVSQDGTKPGDDDADENENKNPSTENKAKAEENKAKAEENSGKPDTSEEAPGKSGADHGKPASPGKSGK